MGEWSWLALHRVSFLDGYVTIPLIISGSRRMLFSGGRRDLVGLVVKMPDILMIFLLPFRQHVME